MQNVSNQVWPCKQQCGFSMHCSFQHFFLFCGFYLFQSNCAIDLQLIPLDFATDFTIFKWLQMDGWTNGRIYQQRDGKMDGHTLL